MFFLERYLLFATLVPCITFLKLKGQSIENLFYQFRIGSLFDRSISRSMLWPIANKLEALINQCYESGSGFGWIRNFSWIRTWNYLFRIRVQAKIKNRKNLSFTFLLQLCRNIADCSLMVIAVGWFFFFIDYKVFS